MCSQMQKPRRDKSPRQGFPKMSLLPYDPLAFAGGYLFCWSWRVGRRRDEVIAPYGHSMIVPRITHMASADVRRGGGFRACGRGERIPTPMTSVTGSE